MKFLEKFAEVKVEREEVKKKTDDGDVIMDDGSQSSKKTVYKTNVISIKVKDEFKDDKAWQKLCFETFDLFKIAHESKKERNLTPALLAAAHDDQEIYGLQMNPSEVKEREDKLKN